ncbi:hypothetical protein ACOME3_006466 [Neoechinorhynchus agilis]
MNGASHSKKVHKTTMILLLLLGFISIVDLAILNTHRRPASSTTMNNGCLDYDVLMENLYDPSRNVDQCGDPLRIKRRSCFYMKIGQDLEPTGFCVMVDYIISTGCNDYIVYSVDPNQKLYASSFNVASSYGPSVWDPNLYELQRKLQPHWKYILEHKARQSIVMVRENVCQIF